MKKIALLFCLVLTLSSLNAQDGGKPIPPYKILTTDSVYVTPAKLKKNAPVMIIYFSPDCTHCQHLTDELTDQLKTEEKQHKGMPLHKIQIVMITWSTLQAIQIFKKDYELGKFPNITIGTEGYTYTVQRYYQVKTTPYIAIYDKNGKPVHSFDKVPKFSDILEAVKKI
jgi:thiol-disulfide isomerase/thioredoxin